MDKDNQNNFIVILLAGLAILVPISIGNKYDVFTIIFQVIIFTLFMYAFHRPIYKILKNFSEKKTRFHKLLKRLKYVNGILVSAKPLERDKLELDLFNREKAEIIVHHAYIGCKDGLKDNVEPEEWYKLSAVTDVEIKSGKSQTSRFIFEDSKYHFFTVMNHATDGPARSKPFGIGKHKFELKIVYDSRERNKKGVIGWYSIDVYYTEPKVFRVLILKMEDK